MLFFELGTIDLRRRQIFTIFDPYPPLSAVFTIIRWQFWPSFDTYPPNKCRHLNLMVPCVAGVKVFDPLA